MRRESVHGVMMKLRSKIGMIGMDNLELEVNKIYQDKAVSFHTKKILVRSSKMPL